MNKQLRSILDELYALDPELRAQEGELVPILEKLMKHKPTVEPDPAFVQRLRMMLNEKYETRSSERAAQNSSPFFSFLHMQTFNYAITGAVLGAIITGPVVYGIMQSGGLPTYNGSTENAIFGYAVEEESAEAFGDLPVMNATDTYGTGQGGGAPVPAAISARPQSGGGGGNPAVDKMMVPYEMTEYTLKFEGEMPELTAAQVEVLKRQKNVSSADLSKILGSFNTGLVDLASFRGAKADSINFYQDTEYGYMVYVSFRDGTISFNANWEKWPNPANNCQDEACFNRYRIKESDLPSDDEAISIAKAFMAEHDVDLSQYGEPEVNNQWRVAYDAAVDKTSFYVPEQVTVTFPLLIEGKPVYDESGYAVGISAGINARVDRVSDVWGIMDQKYVKSSYKGVTDAAQVTAFLDKYGKIPAEWRNGDMTIKSADVTLGTPEMGFVKRYTYTGGLSEELMIPALIFPVTNVSEGAYFNGTTVAVPLAEEMLNDTNNGGGMPRPMPLIMEDGPAVKAAE